MRYYIYLDKEFLKTLFAIFKESDFNIDVFEFTVRNSYTLNNNISVDPTLERGNESEDHSRKEWDEKFSSSARDSNSKRNRVGISYDNGNSYNYQTERKYLNITDITDIKNMAFYHDLFEKIKSDTSRDATKRIYIEKGFIKINNKRNIDLNINKFFMINNSFVWYDNSKLDGDIDLLSQMSCELNVVGYKMNCAEDENNKILKAIAMYIE